ncbi:hypothetical protein [Tessaracoccus massiliensis]|uniref:hypothetical protein n=1 Tax=Tessaracoccus massiliensis TaxID=1522311 RepID=UPI00058F1159|nr:hypothetical protein [Tessaracoccus massiliensis]
MPDVRALFARAVDVYLGSKVARGVALLLLGGRAFLDGVPLYDGTFEVLIGERFAFTYPPIAAPICRWDASGGRAR